MKCENDHADHVQDDQGDEGRGWPEEQECNQDGNIDEPCNDIEHFDYSFPIRLPLGFCVVFWRHDSTHTHTVSEAHATITINTPPSLQRVADFIIPPFSLSRRACQSRGLQFGAFSCRHSRTRHTQSSSARGMLRGRRACITWIRASHSGSTRGRRRKW